MAYSSLATRRLGRRLLLAMGATPLGASLLQGCVCGDPPDLEVTIDELADMQDAVRLGIAQREADCFGTGTGGAGGMIGLGGGGMSNLGGLGGAAGFGGLGGVEGLGGTIGSAGGRNPVCDEALPDWVTQSPRDWYDWYLAQPATDQALSWDPASGCPVHGEVGTLQSLLIHSEDQPSELVSSTAETCVYDQIHYCSGGRPFLVARRPRTAPLVSQASREAKQDELDRALVSAWCADAQMEHASIAAFARLCLQLMALGAPLSLVREAQAASLDEATHAALCLEQAVAHGGGPYEWSPLDMDDATSNLSARELLITNIIEGCIGETFAAARSRAQAETAVDPELSRRLHALADDEERHAALAWNILKWQLQGDYPDLRRLALEVFQSQMPQGAATDAPHEADSRWRDAGRLRASEAAEIDRATWMDAVVPVLAAALTAERAVGAPAPHSTRTNSTGSYWS